MRSNEHAHRLHTQHRQCPLWCFTGSLSCHCGYRACGYQTSALHGTHTSTRPLLVTLVTSSQHSPAAGPLGLPTLAGLARSTVPFLPFLIGFQNGQDIWRAQTSQEASLKATALNLNAAGSLSQDRRSSKGILLHRGPESRHRARPAGM